MADHLTVTIKRMVCPCSVEAVARIAAHRSISKPFIIDRIHYGNDSPELKLHIQLSQDSNYYYTRRSRPFSSTRGITMERFATLERLEKSKRLLVYDQQNISEFTEQLDFSRPAYRFVQYTQETGMTPSEF